MQTRQREEGGGAAVFVGRHLSGDAACVLIEQDSPAVVVFRRAKEGFVRETYEGLDAVIPLSEIEIALPLADVYETVEFVPEVEENQ